jgi:hypothetical protein
MSLINVRVPVPLAVISAILLLGAFIRVCASAGLVGAIALAQMLSDPALIGAICLAFLLLPRLSATVKFPPGLIVWYKRILVFLVWVTDFSLLAVIVLGMRFLVIMNRP